MEGEVLKPPFFDMFKGKSEAFTAFKERLYKEAERIIQDNGSEFEDYIREQLSVGLDGNENKLTPSYTEDPFFKSPEAGNWYNRAESYKKWKQSITPPAPSYLGYPAREANTPNLIIVGNFYASIKAFNVDGGIRIGSQGFTDAGDIESKYGSQIYAVSPKARAFFLKYRFKKEFEQFLNKYK